MPVLHKFDGAYDEDEDLHGTDLGELIRASWAVEGALRTST
jgi:hypothetical protein